MQKSGPGAVEFKEVSNFRGGSLGVGDGCGVFAKRYFTLMSNKVLSLITAEKY